MDLANITQVAYECLNTGTGRAAQFRKVRRKYFPGISRNLVGKRVFGGQVLGQALRAASYTTDRPAHSLHAYFLFGGDVNAPIIYEVDRIRDGKSFVSRQVRAIQHGRTILCVWSLLRIRKKA